MSDNDSDIQEMSNEGTPASRQDTSPDAFYLADALAMFTRQLDNALQKQKQELCLEIDAKIGLQEKPTTVTTPKFRFEGNSKQHGYWQ